MAEPAKKEEGKKEVKKVEKKAERGVLMGLFLFLLAFVVMPCAFAAGLITIAYLIAGGQITWHGI
jgi:hypothetical protein